MLICPTKLEANLLGNVEPVIQQGQDKMTANVKKYASMQQEGPKESKTHGPTSLATRATDLLQQAEAASSLLAAGTKTLVNMQQKTLHKSNNQSANVFSSKESLKDTANQSEHPSPESRSDNLVNLHHQNMIKKDNQQHKNQCDKRNDFIQTGSYTFVPEVQKPVKVKQATFQQNHQYSDVAMMLENAKTAVEDWEATIKTISSGARKLAVLRQSVPDNISQQNCSCNTGNYRHSFSSSDTLSTQSHLPLDKTQITSNTSTINSGTKGRKSLKQAMFQPDDMVHNSSDNAFSDMNGTVSDERQIPVPVRWSDGNVASRFLTPEENKKIFQILGDRQKVSSFSVHHLKMIILVL